MSLRLLPIVVLVLGCATTGPEPEDPELLAAQAEQLAAELLRQGDDAARQGKLNDALAMYARSVAESPSADAWVRVGAINTRMDNAAQAANAYQQAIEIDPENARAFEELGLVYLASNHATEARAQLDKSVSLDDQRWRSYNGLGILADLDKDYAQAIEFYRKALAVHPQSPLLVNNLGYSHYLSGELDEARNLFLESLAMDTSYTPPRYNLGLLYAREGAYDDALTMLASVMEVPAAYNDVGYIALKNADYANAERFLEEAIRLSATHFESAHQNLLLAQAKRRGRS